MTEEQALYVRDGDAFVGTGCTKGSWHADGQSGGAVLALLGHVLEDVPTLTDMSLSRLTVDIVRAVPVGRPLHIRPTIVREGKKIQVVDFVVGVDDTELVRARALRLRDADLTALDGLPQSTTDHNPSAALPPPDELEGSTTGPVSPTSSASGPSCAARPSRSTGSTVRGSASACRSLPVNRFGSPPAPRCPWTA